jgi:hypothetical protein
LREGENRIPGVGGVIEPDARAALLALLIRLEVGTRVVALLSSSAVELEEEAEEVDDDDDDGTGMRLDEGRDSEIGSDGEDGGDDDALGARRSQAS